jgi:hypothetical protein
MVMMVMTTTTMMMIFDLDIQSVPTTKSGALQNVEFLVDVE